MKVVLFKSDVFKQGGVEKYTRRLAAAFKEKGCQVTILTSGEVPLGTTGIHTFGKFHGFNVNRIQGFDRACQKWVEDNRPEIVFGMDRNTHQTHYRAGNGVHAEYLMKRIARSSWLKKTSLRYNPLHRKILHFEKQTFEDPRLNILFTNSDMVKREILGHYRIDERKIEVVHNGVEWHEMQPAFDEWPAFKHNDRYELLFVGNEYERKGLPELLRALSMVRLPYHLTVVGKERHVGRYEQLTCDLNIEKHVTFCGVQSNILPFYQRADALVLPSRYDPFANVTVEALAMGLFVITSQDNGGAEVIKEGMGTVIADIDERESFAALLEKSFEKVKTVESALKIRAAVCHLDFSKQLAKIVDRTVESALYAL